VSNTQSGPGGARRPLWKRVAGPVVIAVLLLLLVVLPEWRSRTQASALCEEIPRGERIALDDLALATRVRELESRFPTLYAASFNANDAPSPQGTGAVVFVHLGAFPFGRNLCVARVNEGLVTDTRTIEGADDYAWCEGDRRLLSDCAD